ncbi:hypothetical protein C8R44DRAFT_871868 [Mycena epipterygia]|nr:hypothetical protein C8R44DRAFT_871868 [Mycena epipterygia]
MHNYEHSLGQPNPFLIALNLREVILTDPEYSRISPSLLIPWRQIRYYRGLYHVEHQLEIVSEAASNLVECGLGFFDEARDIADDKIVTLPQLRRLYVADSDFLTQLTAPVLDVLDSLGTVHPVLDFVNRSSCRLTRLLLEACDPADALIRLLGDLPSLEYLLVEAWYWDEAESNNFFNSMTVSGSSALCPSLTSFAYGNNSFSRDGLLAVVAMVQSRLHPGSPCRLLSLRLFPSSSNSPIQERIMEETQRLVDQGLDVGFLSNTEAQALIAKDCP